MTDSPNGTTALCLTKPDSNSCADPKASAKLRKGFQARVRLEIVGFGMEQEYADVVDLNFCTVLGKWYMSGHFPCGWRGEYPDGILVVF